VITDYKIFPEIPLCPRCDEPMSVLDVIPTMPTRRVTSPGNCQVLRAFTRGLGAWSPERKKVTVKLARSSSRGSRRRQPDMFSVCDGSVVQSCRRITRNLGGAQISRKPGRATEPNDSRPRPALPKSSSRKAQHRLAPAQHRLEPERSNNAAPSSRQ